VSDGPIALGLIAHVWEGNHRGKRVSVKYLGVPLTDDETFKKVCVLHGTSSSHLLKNTCGPHSHSARRSLSGKG